MSKLSAIDIANYFISLIIEVEDRWWMEYDCGEPSEDITSHLIEHMRLLKKDKQAFINSCVRIEGF